ncbi:MAG: NYN domain-containing protein [Acidobacteriota bacterium]
MFVDLENIALGVRDSDIRAFEVNLILERLLEKGKIIAKKAYADWERYSEFKRAFHLAAIELIDIPQKRYSGKNSADIKMVVDAMDLCYSKEHVDTFVLVSGDSDFSPLVSKLKENDKYVIGIGVKNSSSDLLIDNCDEFIYYEDVWRDAVSSPRLDDMPKQHAEAFKLMTDAILALHRENKDVIWGSMVKQTMKRKKPSFNEGYHGYSTFSELLEDAEAKGLITLSRDQRSGNYIIKEFAAAKARHAGEDDGSGSDDDRSGHGSSRGGSSSRGSSSRSSSGRGSSSRGSSGRGSNGRSSNGRSRSRGGRRGGRSRSR